MQVQIKEWGNSQGVRIPKELLREAGISLNEILDITASNGIIMLSKPFKHKTLEERAAEFDGRLNLDGEYDWGQQQFNGRSLAYAVATDEIQGYVQCEKLALLDLTVRGHKKISRLMLNDIINITDAVQGILIMMIIGGIYFELQTPGIGFPLAVAVAGAVLYFAPLYLEGFAASWELLVFVLGVILLLLEVFVIPGFGVAGVSGIVCMVGALVLAGVDDFSFDFLGDFAGTILRSLFVVVAASLLSLGLSFWLGARLLGSRRWAFALHAEQRPEDGFVGVDMTVGQEVDKQGYAVTDLRPGGKIRIDGELYDAVAEQGDYIPKNTPVKVVKYQAGQLYVVKTGK